MTTVARLPTRVRIARPEACPDIILHSIRHGKRGAYTVRAGGPADDTSGQAHACPGCVATNKTLTEFLLGSGLQAAAAALADRRSFVLDDAAWQDFVAALDAPPADNPALRTFLHRRPPWKT